MKIDLSGKVALVTGASRGIGAAIARGLSDSGASVALHYNKNREEAESVISELNSTSKMFQADLSSSDSTIQLFEQVITTFGKLEILICNAGIAIESNADKEISHWIEDWSMTMAVNLEATGILNRLAVNQFMESGGGRIINISSRAAFRGDTKDYLAYAASKGGVVALTRSIARSYGKQGIKAFNVAPGFVRTDMAQDFMDAYGEEYALNDIALPELTEPKDLAPTVVFLASGLADHATGCTIDINAGSYVH